MTDTADVVVLGAGVIGFGIAWRAAQRGLAVTVIDPAPGSGASGTAAGMLAPVTELHFAEQALLELNLASAARYPAFVAELEEIVGRDVGYRRCGTLSVAWDGADLQGLRDLHRFQQGLGLAAELLTGRALRELEPRLAPGLPGGVLAPDDHQVDPVALVESLAAAAAGAGAQEVRRRVAELRTAGERVVGVRLDDGSELCAERVVLACGAWSRLPGLPGGAVPPVRPVKGQTLHLRGQLPIAHVVRGSVRGSPVYLVPRGDGRVVVGASSEEAGFDLRPRAGAVYELLRDAQALVPGVTELELVEVRTSLRPGSPDNAPVVGEAAPGLVVATGHYRNGILLAPVTADGVAALLAGDVLPPEWSAFSPHRFDPAGSPGGSASCA